ncbi:unnamed protein product [Rhizophagus irregularis]|nr:unnamed protein product [Rhizophagus irregularis]
MIAAISQRYRTNQCRINIVTTNLTTFSKVFLEDHDILNETQIGNVKRIDVSVNEDINRYDFPEDERINSRWYDISDDEDRNFNHQEQEYDDSEYEEEENILELNQGIEFEICELVKSYLNEYAKQ